MEIKKGAEKNKRGGKRKGKHLIWHLNKWTHEEFLSVNHVASSHWFGTFLMI